MVNLSLTEHEALALRQMIDAAVRGHGLKAAEVGVHLDMKIAKAMEATKTVNGSGTGEVRHGSAAT